ncbi:MAG TPA: hypothetical protein VHT91_47195 [Kofleriaceae bacterium]|nr:hypothetical protein [Kofleriaceae bacterium]
MNDFRPMGPSGLELWLATHGAGPSPVLDEICAQKDAHTSRLYWFTELPAAIAEARRSRRPILSLRLLGRLDEELSCANSRFFRKLLYPEPRINQMLRNEFVLHWQSVRPVPKITIDFGDGRRIERTLTGNSVHVVLDMHGRAADALPGLMSREVFLEQLVQARYRARAGRGELAELHRRAASAPPPRAAVSRAVAASRIAATKHVVEAPLLRAVELDVAADTAQNLALHRRIHEAFAARAEWTGLDGFVEWIYAELFEMPLGDAALGLDVADPFPLAAVG